MFYYNTSKCIQMCKNQKVTFVLDAKPPNYGPMKIHTKRKDNLDSVYNLMDLNVGDFVEKDIILVMSQTGVTREMAIAALRKNDGDIVNAIMELVCD